MRRNKSENSNKSLDVSLIWIDFSFIYYLFNTALSQIRNNSQFSTVKKNALKIKHQESSSNEIGELVAGSVVFAVFS